MHRVMRGDWVAWKPLIAPQAMVMNRSGQMGRPAGSVFTKKSVLGRTGRSLSMSEPASPKAITSNRIEKKG